MVTQMKRYKILPTQRFFYDSNIFRKYVSYQCIQSIYNITLANSETVKLLTAPKELIWQLK